MKPSKYVHSVSGIYGRVAKTKRLSHLIQTDDIFEEGHEEYRKRE